MIKEITTYSMPKQYYARFNDVTTKSLETEVKMVRHCKKIHDIDFTDYKCKSCYSIPNIKFSAVCTWILKQY